MSSLMRQRLWRVAQICAIALAIEGCQRSSVDADRSDTAAFYRGRTVRILVGASPGGGQDLYARVMASHFARQIDGEPNVIVENMPGAGGLVAATYLAHRATPDGLTIGLLGPQPTFVQLGPHASFDVRTLPIIGSPADDGPVCVFGHEQGYSLDAWRRGRTPRVGMTRRGSPTAAYGLLLTEALGLAVKPVTGYPGTAEIKAAIASGEIDAVCVSRNSFVASFQPLDQYDVLLQTARPESTMFPGVPTADQLITSERGRTLLKIVEAVGTLSRYYAAPPGTPPTRVEALRSAFVRTMQSREFLAAAAAAQLEIRPLTHVTLSAHIDALLASPPDVRREMAALLNPGS